MTYKNCSHCGHPNPMDHKFCSACGAVFRNAVPATHKYEQTIKRRTPVLIIVLLVLLLSAAIFIFMLWKHFSTPDSSVNTPPPQQTVCSHSWTAADCVNPQICRNCGATTGTPLGHRWIEATVSAPKTCSSCGLTEGAPLETVPNSQQTTCSHSWTAADCLNPQICRNCGATTGVPRGHQWIEATYSSPKTCSSCGLSEGDPLENSLVDLLRERLPIVTYAMTSTRLVYGYEDEALTQKNSSVFMEPGKGEIVITDISDDGAALKVYFRTYSTQAGYDVLWFPFADIIQVEEVSISQRSAGVKMDTYKPFHSSYGESRYGGMEIGWEFTYLGSHESGYYVITYPIYEQKVYKISVFNKIALVKAAP